MLILINLTFLEQVNQAANAVIAAEAGAARVLLAAQNLDQCRRENNPYQPGNFLLGPPRNLMWAQDPCHQEEAELASATADHQAAQQLAQISGAPTPADPSAAVAPVLSDTYDMNMAFDPIVPETEFTTPSPSLSNQWSPDSILNALALVQEQMEVMYPDTCSSSETSEEMELILEDIQNLGRWCPWDRPLRRPRKKYQYLPKNKNWIGKWVPA